MKVKELHEILQSSFNLPVIAYVSNRVHYQLASIKPNRYNQGTFDIYLKRLRPGEEMKITTRRLETVIRTANQDWQVVMHIDQRRAYDIGSIESNYNNFHIRLKRFPNEFK